MASISSPPTTKPASNTLSPLPQTPTSSRSIVGAVPVTPDNNMMIPPHILASYVGVVDPIGPKTPIQTYPTGGWVGGGSGTSDVHPLQRAILIQNQFTTQVCVGGILWVWLYNINPFVALILMHVYMFVQI